DLDLLVEGPAAAWYHNSYVEMWRRSASTDRASDTAGLLTTAPPDPNDPDDAAAVSSGREVVESLYGLSTLYSATAPARGHAPAPPGPRRDLRMAEKEPPPPQRRRLRRPLGLFRQRQPGPARPVWPERDRGLHRRRQDREGPPGRARSRLCARRRPPHRR